MIIDLGNSPDVTANQVGGKAAGLYRLAENGFPIPPAWVVPTAAFNSHVASSGGIVANLNHGIEIDSGMLEAIQKAILETPMDRLLEDDIKNLGSSAESVGRRLAGSAVCRRQCPQLTDSTWAVRSSARAEDSSQASYSGLFRTVLGVAGAEDMISAVKTVWASVFSPEALAYHSRFSEEPFPQMAVLLMPMLDAISAGVAASADPVTGNPFRVVISACRGLGTTVVAGGRNCDRYVLDRDSLEVLEQQPGGQSEGEFLSPAGGTETRTVPEAAGEELALDRTTLQSLGNLARRIDDLFAARVDVEFAITHNQVTILQARPLLGLPHWFPDDPRDSVPSLRCCHNEWDGPLSPFSVSRIRGLSSCVGVLPTPTRDRESGLVHQIQHGRLFFRDSADDEPEDPDAPPYWDDMRFLDEMRNLAQPADYYRDWLAWSKEFYESVVPTLRKRSQSILELSRCELEDLSPQGFCEFLTEGLDLEAHAQAYYTLSAHPATEVIMRLEIIIKFWVCGGDYRKAEHETFALIRGRRQLDFERDAELLDIARSGEGLEAFITRWGYSFLVRDEELEITLWKSWREDQAPLHRALEVIRRGSRQSLRDDAEQRAKQAILDQARIRKAILQSNEEDGAWRAEVFDSLVDAARTLFPYKDDRDIILVHTQSALRWILLEAGRRLVRHGVARVPEDVFLLRDKEILQHFSGQQSPLECDKIIEARRAEQRRLARYSLPQPPSCGREEPRTTEGGQRLHGCGASAGTAQGKARVVDIHHPEEVENLEPGEVLVIDGEAKMGWTMYLHTISALVYTGGNWLCHESNLCRELGIPAVVAFEDSNGIRTGQSLRVNGTEGWVEILSE